MLVQVKENQPSLLRIIERISRTDTALSSSESFDDKKRSREESRKVDVFDASPTLENTDWDGLIVRVIKVTRATLVRRAKDRSWELRFDISFYVCSAPITARKAADAIRGHWSIENRNHYVRDVAMLEDASRIRKNPGIFARVRSFALNILRANGENNISQAMWHNVLDITRPLNYRFMQLALNSPGLSMNVRIWWLREGVNGAPSIVIFLVLVMFSDGCDEWR